MDPSEQQECVAQIAGLPDQRDPNGLSSSDQYSAGPSMNEQRAMRRNGNGDRCAAMDRATHRHYSGGSFLNHFPEARGIRVLG